MLDDLLKSLSEEELRFIAGLDYGVEADRHLRALQALVGSQNGFLVAGQHWFPYEVIELGAHGLKPGHEREFTVCSLLVQRAVVSGFDTWTDLESKLDDRARDYDALPALFRDAILDAYQAAGRG